MKQFQYHSAALLLGGKLDPSLIERAFRLRPIKASAELNYVNKANVKLAAVQMLLRPYRSLKEMIAHLQDIVEEAQNGGAQLISFPEYVGLLPLLISPTFCRLAEDFIYGLEEQAQDKCLEMIDFFSEQLSEMLFTCYYNTFALLANRSRLYIHAGSTILKSHGRLYERCFLFGPDGETALEQDKIFLSPREKALGLCAGEDLELCDTPLGRLAILPGKDSYYFESAKAARQLGAQILLCPISPAGQEPEVAQRCGPWMRCQEQAVYAIAPRLTGSLGSVTFQGKAGIFGPYEATRSRNGILAQSADGQQNSVLVSRVNLDYLELPVDLYASDHNPELCRQLSAAYHDFPKPLAHLAALEGQGK